MFSIRKYIPVPYLELIINLGIFSVESTLMKECYERQIKIIVGLNVRIFYKWIIRFNLYTIPR